jgi:hypothetical protein
MQIKSNFKERQAYNWELGNDTSRFVVETKDLFEYVNSLKKLEIHYLNTQKHIYTNLKNFDTVHYTNIKDFLLNFGDLKIKLSENATKGFEHTIKYPEEEIEKMLTNINKLKSRLGHTESVLEAKFKQMISLQKELVNNFIQVEMTGGKVQFGGFDKPKVETENYETEKELLAELEKSGTPIREDKENKNPFLSDSQMDNLGLSPKLERGLFLTENKATVQQSKNEKLAHYDQTNTFFREELTQSTVVYNKLVDMMDSCYCSHINEARRDKENILSDFTETLTKSAKEQAGFVENFTRDLKILSEKEDFMMHPRNFFVEDTEVMPPLLDDGQLVKWCEDLYVGGEWKKNREYFMKKSDTEPLNQSFFDAACCTRPSIVEDGQTGPEQPFNEREDQNRPARTDSETGLFESAFATVSNFFDSIAINLGDEQSRHRAALQDQAIVDQKNLENIPIIMEQLLFDGNPSQADIHIFCKMTRRELYRREIIKWFNNVIWNNYGTANQTPEEALTFEADPLKIMEIPKPVWRTALELSFIFLTACADKGDNINAILYVLATQELHWVDLRKNGREYFLANYLSRNKIFYENEFWVTLYQHLYNKSSFESGTQASSNFELILSQETFYKNFQLFKSRMDTKKNLLQVFDTVVRNLDLLKLPTGAEVTERVKNDCIVAWEKLDEALYLTNVAIPSKVELDRGMANADQDIRIRYNSEIPAEVLMGVDFEERALVMLEVEGCPEVDVRGQAELLKSVEIEILDETPKEVEVVVAEPTTEVVAEAEVDSEREGFEKIESQEEVKSDAAQESPEVEEPAPEADAETQEVEEPAPQADAED